MLPWLLPMASGALAWVLGRRWPLSVIDALHYRTLATGQRGAVPAPFSGRVLGPATAAWLGRVTGGGVDAGFLMLGLLCLAGLATLVFLLLRARETPAGLAAAVFLMPLWVSLFHGYYLPDLIHAALLAAILWCLVAGWSMAAMLLLFPAYLARESTLVVAVCLLAVAAWRRMPAGVIAAGLVATLGGALASGHYLRLGAGNIHGASNGLYLLGKVVWSLSRNLFGVPLWSNTLPECAPRWTTALPGWLQGRLGNIHEVGVCQVSAYGPARVVLAWFGWFGLGPALALWMVRHRPRRNPAKVPQPAGAEVALRFCLAYGGLMVLLAPLLGASTDRLVGYGWPLFLVALPWLAAEYDRASPGPNRLARRENLGLLALHLATCWLGWWGYQQMPTRVFVVTGAAVLLLNVAGYGMLRRGRVWGGAEAGVPGGVPDGARDGAARPVQPGL